MSCGKCHFYHHQGQISVKSYKPLWKVLNVIDHRYLQNKCLKLCVFSIIMKKIAKRHWNSDDQLLLNPYLRILLAINHNVTSFYYVLHFEPATVNCFLLSLFTAELLYKSNAPYLFLIETKSDRHKQILL